MLACTPLLSVDCKKNAADEPAINIQGFKLTDNLGNQMGVNGNADDDWQLINWSQLSAREQSFLNFADTVSLSNTVVATITAPMGFPSPCMFATQFACSAADSVKVKVALVDAQGRVYRTFARKIKGWQFGIFDVRDRSEIPSGKSLRFYYSFSAAAQQNFKAGYGDIKVCDDPAPFTNCF